MKFLLSSVLFIFLFLTGCVGTKAQTKMQTGTYTTRKTTNTHALGAYKKGNEYVQKRQLDKAIGQYKKALKKDPLFVDAMIKIGGVHYEKSDLESAKIYFEKVVKMAPDYQPRVYYTLAVIATKSKDYEQAIRLAEKYLSYPKIKGRRRAKGEKKLANWRFAKEAVRHPLPFKPKNLGPNINTSEPEYLPSFTADEQFLIFTRRVHNQEDFYISRKENGQFLPAVPMKDINTDKNEGAQCISSDGRFLAMTICGRDEYSRGSCDIYFSEKKDGSWTPIKKMGTAVNSKRWDAQPSLSANGQAIYFASERAGGLGGRDIWVSYRNESGKWGVPQNLGDSINTAGADQAPFIHPDGKTLYFMSDGHPGMGGGDLFFSKRLANGQWSKAKNLGYPINDEGIQGALVVSLDGRKGYFAGPEKSASEGDFFGGAIDIFEFELPEEIRPDLVTYVKGEVLDFDSNKKLDGASVELVDLKTGKSFYKATVDKDGTFLAVLPQGNYALNVSKAGYLFFSENYELNQPASFEKPFSLVAKLRKIIVKPSSSMGEKQVVILKNVFFDSGSAHLKSSSDFELDRVAQMLKDAKNLKMQINGHTDNVGSEAANLLLSEQRAKAVYDYLIQQGVSANQLTYKGFGESQPIDTNDSEEGRSNNRRTEMEPLNL